MFGDINGAIGINLPVWVNHVEISSRMKICNRTLDVSPKYDEQLD